MNQPSQDEKNRLHHLAPKFSSYDGFNAFLIERRYKHLAQFFHGDSCLELGSADGAGTMQLIPHFKRIVALDGTPEYVDSLRKQVDSSVEVVCALIEEYKPKEQFDTIILAHVLEHVDEPIAVLKAIKKMMGPKTRFILDVPNARSLHRMAGVKMGLIPSVETLHEGDLRIGHRRVYTPETLQADIKSAGLKLERWGGMFIKPLSNNQIAEQWSPEMVEAYFVMGEEVPEIASEIYALCTL